MVDSDNDISVRDWRRKPPLRLTPAYRRDACWCCPRRQREATEDWGKGRARQARSTISGSPAFNFNVEEWTPGGKDIERTIAICSTVSAARAVFYDAIKEKPAGWFMIRSRTMVMRRHPKGDW